jgi:hypothetical protein
MHEETQLFAGFPYFVIIVLLFFGISLLMLLEAYYIYGRGRRLTSAKSFVNEALIKFNWPLWLLITTAFFVISNYLLVRGLAVGIWDVDGQYYPYQVLVADYARAGRFIHWDPWSNAGRPILGDPQVGVFSPINFAVGLVTGGKSSGFIVYWLIMWWLGGFGILMLARHLKVPSWGGGAVALGFLFCGAYTGHAEHTSFITSFSFLPLIVWRLDAALCLRKAGPAIEAGALWGLSALAGYPGLTIITGCFLTLWALGRWLFPESFGGEHVSANANSVTQTKQCLTLGFSFSALLLALIVGLVILSPTYVAFFFEGAGMNTRVTALSRDRAIGSNALHPGALSTFASPYLTIAKFHDQMNGQNNLWSYTDVSSASIYAGAIISVLAVCALLGRPRDGWRWWVLGVALLSIGCALGQALPLRGWLYDWFYPMRFFRHAAIFRLYYLFAVAVLALLATRDLANAMRSPADRIWGKFLAASLCVAAGALLVFFVSIVSVAETRKMILLLGSIHALWIWLVICVVAFIGWRLRGGWVAGLLPLLLFVLAASDAFLTSLLSRPTIGSTRSESLKRWASLDDRHSPVLDLTGNGLLREESSCYPKCEYLTNDQLITKVPVFNSYATGENYFHREMVSRTILKQTAVGTKRVWFSKVVGKVAPTKSNFISFVERTDLLGAPPLVVHSREDILRLGAAPSKHRENSPTHENEMNQSNKHEPAQIEKLPPVEGLAINLIKYLPDELVFTVQCPTDGWLLVTDRWARSWRAEVNGKQTGLYVGNFIFRAVQVSAGQNKITFTYHPLGFPWLVITSWGTLAVIALSGAYRGLKGGELRSSISNRNVRSF